VKIRIFDLDIHLTFACLREAPPCGTKAGILNFDIALSPIGIEPEFFPSGLSMPVFSS
jgi:hypothetical protein